MAEIRMNTDSQIKKRLIKQIQKRYNVSNSEIPHILGSIKRFVNVSHRIMTEPQVQLQYKTIKLTDRSGSKTNHTEKVRIINTTMEELIKIENDKPTPIKEFYGKVKKFTSKDGK